MSIQRTNPINTLQNVTSLFKQLEKKLDKLQDDINYHGHTLSELHVMLANMSGGIFNNFTKIQVEDTKKQVNKTTAMHDNHLYREKPVKIKRKSTIQPLSSKLVTRSFPVQRYGRKSGKDLLSQMKNNPSSPNNATSGKRVTGERKCETFRKSQKSRNDDKKENLSPQLSL